MENLKHFLAFIQLFLNKEAKPIFFQWLAEYFRENPIPTSNSNILDPLELMNSASVCSKLKCNRHHLAKLVSEGRIHATRHGNAFRFRRKDVQEYIDKEFS